MYENQDFRNYYDLIDVISKNNYITIYEVKKPFINEKRVIKVFDKNEMEKYFWLEFYRNPDEEEIIALCDDFFNKINTMEELEGKFKNNINIIKFYEYFMTKNEFAIVMELCDCSLKFFLLRKNEPLPPGEIKEILTQLNNTFRIMNNKGIIHGNITFDNILIKFIDIERKKYIVKLNSSTSNLLAHYHQFFEENEYNAPEILNEEDFTEECDLWSLGVIIYFLSFKRFPPSNKNNLMNKGDFYLDDLIRKLLKINQYERLTWEEYFNHPFFFEKSLHYKDCEICWLQDEIYIERKKNENLQKEINKLETNLKKEEKKNRILEEKIFRLEKRIKKLEKKLNKLQNIKISKLSDEIISKDYLYKTIFEKEKEINELTIKLKRYPFELNEGEKLLSVNFSSVDQRLQNYSIICKNTDIFNKLENKLYEDYKEFDETEIYFTVNGNKINKNKSLDFNKIKNNDTIIINILDL